MAESCRCQAYVVLDTLRCCEACSYTSSRPDGGGRSIEVADSLRVAGLLVLLLSQLLRETLLLARIVAHPPFQANCRWLALSFRDPDPDPDPDPD